VPGAGLALADLRLEPAEQLLGGDIRVGVLARAQCLDLEQVVLLDDDDPAVRLVVAVAREQILGRPRVARQLRRDAVRPEGLDELDSRGAQDRRVEAGYEDVALRGLPEALVTG